MTRPGTGTGTASGTGHGPGPAPLAGRAAPVCRAPATGQVVHLEAGEPIR